MEKMLHAVVLSGPGEDTARRARELAAELLCQSPGPRPCRVCRHCRKVLAGIHPDVITVERSENSKGALRRDMTVEQIRALVADAPVLPNEAEAKVYILPEADAMNPAAQNAFLKLLEEPPSFVTFLLCAESPEKLLETVRSRCADIHLQGRRAPDPQAAERANGYLDALDDDLARLRWSLAMERLDGAAFLEVVEAARELAAERGWSPERLLAAEDLLDRAEKLLRANVGCKHVAGFLSAARIENSEP